MQDLLQREQNQQTDVTQSLLSENNPILNNKAKFPKILIVFIVFILLVILIFVFYILKKITPVVNNTIVSKENIVNVEAKVGWKDYQNDILGIKFFYPEKWGEINSSYENITNLSTINEDYFNEENNDNKYMITFHFSENNLITLNFINNLYPGKKYPNGYALKLNPMDNFNVLKQSNNICDYNFNFTNLVNGRNVSVTEKENNCENNIKTTLIIDNPDSTSYETNTNYYNYSLKQFLFKKLNNKYFDNLLIENNITSHQSDELNLTQEQLLQKVNLSEEFIVIKNDFKEFVNSISIFTPPIPTQIIFKEIKDEDQNLITIRKYYHYLATKNFSQAYSMYQNKKVDFDTYFSWYNKVYNTNIININKINTDTYKLDVDIYEDNKKMSKYRVIMQVVGDKLNTISSEQITSNEVRLNNLISYTRLKSGKNEIVLNENGKEIVIYSGDNDFENKFNTTKYFIEPHFSPKGDYLTYFTGGWEIGLATVYDIKNKKLINFPQTIETCSSDFKFSSDDKYLLVSSFPGICSGNQAKIYNLKTGLVVYDFFKNINSENNYEFNLNYSDKNSNIVNFIYKDEKGNIIKDIKYNLDSDSIIQ